MKALDQTKLESHYRHSLNGHVARRRRSTYERFLRTRRKYNLLFLLLMAPLAISAFNAGLVYTLIAGALIAGLSARIVADTLHLRKERGER